MKLLAQTLGEEERSHFMLTELTKPLMQQASSGEERSNGKPKPRSKEKTK